MILDNNKIHHMQFSSFTPSTLFEQYQSKEADIKFAYVTHCYKRLALSFVSLYDKGFTQKDLKVA